MSLAYEEQFKNESVENKACIWHSVLAEWQYVMKTVKQNRSCNNQGRLPGGKVFIKIRKKGPLYFLCHSQSLLNYRPLRGTWAAQSSWLSVRLRLRSWSHGSRVRAPHGALCWQLRAQNLLPILCLPLSLPLSPSRCISLCLSKINVKKHFFKIIYPSE